MPEIDPALEPAAVAGDSNDSDASEVNSPAQADDPGLDVIAGSVEHGLATETSAASDEPSEDFDGAAATLRTMSRWSLMPSRGWESD